MGAKRNKLKKVLSPTPASPPPAMDDDNDLMDDLMAQLDSRDQNVQAESATVLNDMQVNKAAATPPPPPTPQNDESKARARYKARQARKAAALAEQYAPSDPEADARLKKEADDEERMIKRVCDERGLEIFEINPDGHCLFSAVADQLAVLRIIPPGQANYATCRHAAADYIHSQPDIFLPFLPAIGGEDAVGATSQEGLMTRADFDRYCLTIRDTGAWGGEPEILALASAYNVPIHVVQGGTPPVVIHQPFGSSQQGNATDKHVVHISYHRRMYGLGEHYNSLRPKRTLSETMKSVFTGT